ncbi:MAG: S-methyl-5'-thioadenosine phosphorylase [Candidatus Micrarchaeota archaeon]|nr:S-methyl-5'-thioadenosine phosphorylase [Candidatus Micrarchaeota archaeon]
MLGVFGGSGLYSFLDGVKKVSVDTPYGAPSAPVAVGTIFGQKVAFLPRHGEHHDFPPHMVNYRANIAAFKEVGVDRILAPCAAGSLSAKVKPGSFVVLDQFFDRTSGRKDTFYDGQPVTHVSMAEPYCPELRKAAVAACKAEKVSVHADGTVVVIQGPRFSSKAESRFFSRQGFEVINMTQYPEVVLAREQAMCYCGIALITDFDAGLEGHPDVKAVNVSDVMTVFKQNTENIRRVLKTLIQNAPKRTCSCSKALDHARL